MSEEIDIYDCEANKTGEIRDKKCGLAKEDYCLGAHGWIVNSDRKFLIQKRSEFKKILPDVWAANGGGVRHGEASIDALVREIYEEIGIKIDKKNVTLLMDKGGPDEWNCWLDFYVIQQDIDLKDVVIDENEVSDVKWASIDEIRDMLKSGELVAVDTVKQTLNLIIEPWGMRV